MKKWVNLRAKVRQDPKFKLMVREKNNMKSFDPYSSDANVPFNFFDPKM